MNRRILIVLVLFAVQEMMALSPSGTLPVMYITTKNGQQVSLEHATDATLYIQGHGNYASLGSQQQQIPLTIKGRGNWTWTAFDKKPYKIVFAQGYGQKLLGMKKSKHWALLAAADDYLGFLKNTAGYSLSEHIGLPYTPHQVPVELVLNNDYLGIYFVTETIRIDNDRVNIHEQSDGETRQDIITGGWLVEIDNYQSEGNISFTEGNGEYMMVTMHSPEDLSAAQRQYITAQLNTLNDAIYAGNPTTLWTMMDLNDAARYYLVQEIMEDCESYHGSCFLYKDRDSTDTRGRSVVPAWHFGPVWDFGNAYDRQQQRFIYDGPTFAQYWIGQIAQDPVFQQRVKQYWYLFRTQGEAKVKADIDAFVNTISQAAKRDAQRWQNSNVRTNADMSGRKQEFLNRMNNRLQWLYSQWGEGDSTPIADELTPVTTQQSAASKRIVNGQLIIRHEGTDYTVLGLPL